MKGALMLIIRMSHILHSLRSFAFPGGIRACRGSAPQWPLSQSAFASADGLLTRRACEPRGRRRRVRIATVSRAKFIAFLHAPVSFSLTRYRGLRESAIGRIRTWDFPRSEAFVYSRQSPGRHLCRDPFASSLSRITASNRKTTMID